MPGAHTRLIIPVETRNREFDAKLLLACAAAERGFTVVLGAKKTLNLGVHRLRRGIYLSKSLTDRNARLYRILRRLGFALVCGDEEGLVHPSPEHYLRTKVGPQAFPLAEALLAWGPENARIWREHPGWRGAPIHVTGNPRTDLLRPELRGLFADEAAALRRRLGRFVLLNTNFSRLNHWWPHMSWQRLLLEQAAAQPERAAGYEVGLARHRKAVYDAFLELVPALARAHADCALVVRPHPSEHPGPWEAAAAGRANVHVVHEGNVVPWLLAAEATIHNGCTTGLEAHLLDRPAIAYQPVTSERFDNHLPNGVSFQAFSADAVLEHVARALRGELVAGGAESAARRKLLERHLAAVDGPLAADRVVNAVAGFAAARPLRRPPAPQWLAGQAGALARRRRKRAEARRAGTRNDPAYLRHVFPDPSPAEVDGRVTHLRALLGRFDGVAARPLAPGVFEVRRAD